MMNTRQLAWWMGLDTLLSKGVSQCALVAIAVLFSFSLMGQTRLVDAATGVDAGDCTGSPCLTIQFAVNQAAAGDDILVSDGTYNENVTINKNDLHLHSVNGAGSVTIQGADANPGLGTIFIDNVTGTQVGGMGEGFTILGYDAASPGIEEAAIYVRGSWSNTVIQDNVITADGEAGFLAEFASTGSNITIDFNTFDGQTFVGAEPAGCGFSMQFTLDNVPRQLAVLTPGLSGVTFTNNTVTGVTGGYNATDDCDQGNTLVTIDSDNSTIGYNLFAGTTTRFASSLRVRGDAASISCNIFDNGGLMGATSHIFIDDSQGAPLIGATPGTIAGIAMENSFVDDGAYIDPPGNPVANDYPYYIYKSLTDAQTVATALGGRTATSANTASVPSACCPDVLSFVRNALNICSGDTVDFTITNEWTEDVTFDLVFVDSMMATTFPKDLDPENPFPYTYASLTLAAGASLNTKDLPAPPEIANALTQFDRGRVLMGITNIVASGVGPTCVFEDIGPGLGLGVGTRVYPEPALASSDVEICSGEAVNIDVDLLFSSVNPNNAGFPVQIDWTSVAGADITGNGSGSIVIYDAAGVETQVEDITEILVNAGDVYGSATYTVIATSAGDDGILGTADDCMGEAIDVVANVAPEPSMDAEIGGSSISLPNGPIDLCEGEINDGTSDLSTADVAFDLVTVTDPAPGQLRFRLRSNIVVSDPNLPSANVSTAYRDLGTGATFVDPTNPYAFSDDVTIGSPLDLVMPVTITYTFFPRLRLTNGEFCNGENVQVQVVINPSQVSITCPADVDYGSMCNVTIPPAATTYDLNTATDPDLPLVTSTCHGSLELVSTMDTMDTGCQRTITRSYVINDLTGATDTCQQQFTFIFDTTSPMVVTCAPDTTIDCGTSLDPAATGMPTSSDNCGISALPQYMDDITPGSCMAMMTIERTWTMTDDCGNTNTCVQTIIVQDTMAPTFMVPVDVEVACGGDIFDFSVVGMPTIVMENCGVKDTSFVDDFSGALTCDSPGYIERTWTLTDSCDNETSMVQTIDLTDVNCLPCPDVMYLTPGDTCLQPPVYEMPNVARIEVLEPGDDGYINLISPLGCFEAGFYNPRFSGYDSFVVVACDTLFGREYCDTTTIILISCDPVACKSFVNLSLDENCTANAVPGMVISPQRFPEHFYRVDVKDAHGNPHSPSFGPDDIGKSFQMTVALPACNNISCWAEITVEDKYGPQIECRDDTMNCIEYQFGYSEPMVRENCGSYTLRRVDELVTNMECEAGFQKLVTQKWMAVDDSGNESDTCVQQIWISRFPMGEIQVDVLDTVLYCGGGYARVGTGDAPSPEVMGVPRYDTLDLYPLPDFFCNMLTEYRDVVLSDHGCTKRVARMWEVREWWCKSDSVRRFRQEYTIVDTVGPELELPVDTIYGLAGRMRCSGEVDLPAIGAEDACHGIDHIDVVYPGGILLGSNGGSVQIEIGVHKVIYRAYDGCYNESTDTLMVVVRDRVAPIAVCEQNTVVTLDNDGIVDVHAETFDDGSFDECGLESMEVRRMQDACASGTDEWGSYVTFCCEDVGTEVMVSLRVTDKSGNSNTCMVRVQVQDKQPPRILGLPDITIDCRYDWDIRHLEVFGKFVNAPADRDSIRIDGETVIFHGAALDGLIIDNCTPVMTETLDTSGMNNCGMGYIERKFTFTDGSGNTSSSIQRITIINDKPFTEAQIVWPVHIDTSDVCGIENMRPELLREDQGFPRFVDEDECSLVGFDYKDEVIDASVGSEACYKIIRHWTVIDWCQLTQGVHPKWYHDQVIIVSNTIAPTIISECRDTVRCVYNVDCEGEEMYLYAEGEDDCTASEDLYWEYEIDLESDGVVDQRGTGNEVRQEFPIGVHRIAWYVEDRCGNMDSCSYGFEIRNCKAPTAYCKNGVVVELTPVDTTGDGRSDIEVGEVWAEDFDEGSHHPCGHPVVLSFSADTNDRVRVYDCDSLVPPQRGVTIWVTDRITGSTSKCQTMVNVQDNNNEDVCGQNLTSEVRGLIQVENGEGISEVEVGLNGGMSMMKMSAVDGSYELGGIPLGGNYTVKPMKGGDAMNGVSTGDLVKIQHHLLGKSKLESPYQYIAADVNNDESVSIADISVLRKLILGVFAEFPQNESWRFVEGSYVFGDLDNPWMEEFPEERELYPFENEEVANFVGVKIGDVTGDVILGVSGNADTRSNDVVKITIEDREIKAGRMYEVVLEMEGVDQVEGYQYTLEWKGEDLELSEVVPNLKWGMGLSNFGMQRVEDGILTTSWTKTDEAEGVNEDKRMFALRFTARADGRLSEMLAITDRVTKREVYKMVGDEMETGGIELEFGGEVEGQFFALYQNEPNPWSKTTIIGFHLPQESAVSLYLFDETGRILQSMEHRGVKGYNAVEINANELFGKGVLYYRLESANHTATKKMVLID